MTKYVYITNATLKKNTAINAKHAVDNIENILVQYQFHVKTFITVLKCEFTEPF